MIDEIELPEPGEATIVSYQTDSVGRSYEIRTFSDADMKEYARAAVLADRERRAQLASRGGVPDARWLLDQYEAFIAAIPVGQENSTRGASAYNWHRAAKATLESLLDAAPSPEVQAEANYAHTVPDECETLHWRGQILSMNELAALAQQPTAVDEAMVFRLAVWMAKHDGCEDPHRLIYEGSPPVPWGEVWNRYEYDARAALTAALLAQQQPEVNP